MYPKNSLVAAITITATVGFSAPSYAGDFLDAIDGHWDNLLRVNQAAAQLPELPGFSFNRDQPLTGVLLRAMLGLDFGENVSFEAHAVEFISGVSSFGLANANGQGLEIGSDSYRSALFTWQQYQGRSLQMSGSIDRLNLSISTESLAITIGRQPINWATTFFFTPNDFFQPFAAQTFYRVYKPGVDAVRIDYGLGSFTTIGLVGALGYERSGTAEPEDRPSFDNSALLGRFSTVFWDIEWTALGGKLENKEYVFGGAFQGEIFWSIGVRGEANYILAEDSDDNRFSGVVGIDRRFESTLHLRAEYFHQTGGGNNPSEYGSGLNLQPRYPRQFYLARNYVAGSASYELTPLLNISALGIYNIDDQSGLASANAVYSLSDEAEGALSIGVPFGKGISPQFQVQSEFGAYPLSVNGEVRIFF